jgi:hypothetical protein
LIPCIVSLQTASWVISSVNKNFKVKLKNKSILIKDIFFNLT